MAPPALAAKVRRKAVSGISLEAILNALGAAVVVVDKDNIVEHINAPAENVLRISKAWMSGREIEDVFPVGSPLVSLIEQARRERAPVLEYDVTVETPRIKASFLTVQAIPIQEEENGHVVLSLMLRGVASAIDRQLSSHRGSSRSVTSMAAMLAHEVRNPLSGIRGAAQLLEQNATGDDRPLARLIRDEVDRISNLIGRMEVFSDDDPPRLQPVNIHQVLDRVERLAATGFGAHIHFKNRFDPSLPPVAGDMDQLVQVFLNLIKNAVEACSAVGGEIKLTTAYQHGVRFAVPGTRERVHLPLIVTVTDNGAGIPDELRDDMFDPFVTSKRNGTGLGLALVAKLIHKHGGVIECESEPGQTEFRVMLPVTKE